MYEFELCLYRQTGMCNKTLVPMGDYVKLTRSMLDKNQLIQNVLEIDWFKSSVVKVSHFVGSLQYKAFEY